jgi:hypothetical protein
MDGVWQPTRSFRFQLALGRVEVCLSAAEVEAGRLSEDSQDWEIDATFFLYALRNLLRSCELAVRSAPRKAACDMERGIEKFNAAIPRLVDLRDVLEHFDDYLEMKGKLQHPPGTAKGKRKPAKAIDPWVSKRRRRAAPGSFGFWAARQTNGDLLVGAGEIELRVDAALSAAREMAEAVLRYRGDES